MTKKKLAPPNLDSIQVYGALTAMELLLTPTGRWIKGEEARSTNGRTTPPTSPTAVQFCLLGAVKRIDGKYESQVVKALRGALPKNYSHIPSFNDDVKRTHAQVIALIKRAKAQVLKGA